MKVLGVSAGAGVILYPFKEVLIGNYEVRKDFKTPNEVQWKLNFGEIPLWRTEELDPNLKPDIILSQPNCGQYSILSHSRRKKESYKEDLSLNLFFSSINLYKPKLALLENLPELLNRIPKNKLKELFPMYKMKFILGSVSQFGNSQLSRKRLVIIFIRNTKRDKFKIRNFKPFEVSEIKHSGDLLEGTYPINVDNGDHFGNINENDPDKEIAIYGGKKMSTKDITKEWEERLKGQKRWYTKPGEAKFKTAPGVYRNLIDDYPATARKANRQFDHHGEMMTPRQLARIQGIPDSFKIWTDSNKRLNSINKGRLSVTKAPPYEIGKWFHRILNQVCEDV